MSCTKQKRGGENVPQELWEKREKGGKAIASLQYRVSEREVNELTLNRVTHREVELGYIPRSSSFQTFKNVLRPMYMPSL